MKLHRHDQQHAIFSELDPLDDALNFLLSLRSKEFTSDLLREKHHFSDSREIKTCSKLIGLYSQNARNLTEQGLASNPEISFLPLYYSILNLIKANLIFQGKRIELEKNRWHGAQYKESEMRKRFLNEEILIKKSGTIPLMYKTISGIEIPKKGLKVKMDDIYTQIPVISAEYNTATNAKKKCLYHVAEIIEDDQTGHYLRILIQDMDYKDGPPKPSMLKAYSELKIVAHNNPQGNWYESKRVKIPFQEFKDYVLQNTKRHLLSDSYIKVGVPYWNTSTPLTRKAHVFNEDLSIMLAYFHLSNIVRYNPEHLAKLMDSRYWIILLGLRKSGIIRMLKLFWGDINKYSFDIG